MYFDKRFVKNKTEMSLSTIKATRTYYLKKKLPELKNKRCELIYYEFEVYITKFISVSCNLI